ncbi:hypothetical protein EB796_007798 [Bugula neritina]|uniref:Hexosyltransferase n=1 Tax=Bugula neritina TaxID=10212 RepID=A0A7J7K7H0_BUGNE|nr:hypothetical protein EB796_007798 [Bugula neritina]
MLLFRYILFLCITTIYAEVHIKQQNNVQKIMHETLKRKAPPSIKIPYKKEYGDVTVNPHNFTFISQPEPCRGNETILVTAHSATQNFQRRLALRNTWANPRILQKYLPKGHQSKLIFILGLPSKSSEQTLINYEQAMYRDLVQVNFMDHYRNNTYKAIYNMKWISSYKGCPEAKLVVKVDDDVIFNLQAFSSFFKTFTHTLGDSFKLSSYFIAGNIQHNRRPFRNPASKWYLSRKDYKYDTFPMWLQGLTYFLSPRLAKEIYNLSFTTPYIFTDDIYIGIVANRVVQLKQYPLNQFYSDPFFQLAKQSLYWKSKPYVFYHSHSIEDFFRLWCLSCNSVTCAWCSKAKV